MLMVSEVRIQISQSQWPIKGISPNTLRFFSTGKSWDYFASLKVNAVKMHA